MSDFREPHLRGGDFLGAFGVLESEGRILMVQNTRRIAGTNTRVWDLPGGQVEAGELLEDALRRELQEEVGLQVRGAPEFLFFQEGERCVDGSRHYAWRSFFYRVVEWAGEPTPGGEIGAVAWMDRQRLEEELRAPYHDSFLRWLEEGGAAFRSRWSD